MFALTDYQFWVAFIGFFIAAFVTFYLPGFLIIKNIDSKTNIQNVILALCLGFVLWTLQGYIFGYLQMRWLSYLYVLVFIILSIKHISSIKQTITYVLQRIAANKLITACILIGMVLQAQVMLGSGVILNAGMHFLGTNSTDGIMHLAYIQKMITTFPINEPGAYMLPLKNYHYWLDLNIAEVARVWKLPAHHIFFQFIPLIFSVVTGIATFLLMRLWTGSKMAGLWALFFLYLAGDAAYLFMLALHNTFGFHTPVIDNGITQFYNMPHAAAKMLFTAGLLAFYHWIKTNKKSWGLLTVALFAPLVGFKIYFGIFAALGLTLVVLSKVVVQFIKIKKKKPLLFSLKNAVKKELFSAVLLFLFAGIAAAIYFPPNAGSGGLEYYPLEWPKLFLGQQNLDLREWWLRMQVYEEAGNIRNIIIYNTFAIVITFICIYGTRIIGFLPHRKLVQLLGWEHMVFFIPGIVIFQILGFSTLQKAGSFNVFNFFVVSSVIMSLFSAYVLYELALKRKAWATIVLIIIVLITIPRGVYEVYASVNTMVARTGGVVPTEELKALQFIKETTPTVSIVQSHPQNELDHITTYVAYFSERDTYISGISMVASHGQPTDPLEKNATQLFASTNPTTFVEQASAQKIKYIYLQKIPAQKLLFLAEPPLFKKKYENENVIILEINNDAHK